MTSADTFLVLRAQQGDRAALDGLLESVQRPLFGYIARLLARSGVAAEDVLQETLLRIVRNLEWLKEARYFRTWAFRIASREAFRALGRSRNAPPLEELDEQLPAPPPLSRDEVRGLGDAVARLSAASQAVVVLHYYEELPLDEIADVLEIPLGTVKSRLAYGLKQLREMHGNRE
jgi:RNA polymerase sigma-70 factor (ECF subfamily)